MTQPLMVEASESDFKWKYSRSSSRLVEQSTRYSLSLTFLKRFHHFVIFDPDLTDKLFDDVFQRDDALGAAELIHDDGKVRFVLLQKL